MSNPMSSNPMSSFINNPTIEKLLTHVGHNIQIVTYGKDVPVNVSIECVDCYEVIYDVDIAGADNVGVIDVDDEDVKH